MFPMRRRAPEKRKHLRASLDTYVNKIVGHEPYLALCRDISCGGMYIYGMLEPKLEYESHVGIELMLPNSIHVIWTVGKVVREETTPHLDGIALQFVQLTDFDRDLIAAYVEGAPAVEQRVER